PRPMLHEKTFTFSFSGLKTAVLRSWNTYSKDQQSNEEIRAAFAYEIQEAITDVLVEKTLFASRQYNAKSILLSGGVAANERLRQKFCERTTLPVFFPMKELCTDNAAMIGSAAYFLGTPKNWRDIEATPDLSVET
ncbi:MAG: hypothetical protein N3A54_06860, partial [Patescibacteria group bacterium]|nr:hypothetical protein [Patescibacteria group bacterium]